MLFSYYFNVCLLTCSSEVLIHFHHGSTKKVSLAKVSFCTFTCFSLVVNLRLKTSQRRVEE